MYHLVDNLQTRTGDAISGYYVKLKDEDGNYATLYADENSTPIVSVSGVADAALTDSEGMYDCYVEDGDYIREVYSDSALTSLQKAVPITPMRVEAGIASQAEAEAGTDNTKHMSPLRVKQAIDEQVAGVYAPKDTPAFTSGASFATNGSRVGITDAASPITPQALVEIVNNGVTTNGLRMSSRWTGTTASPYQNNDNSLWETYNTTVSDSENYSWSISAPNAYNDIPAAVHDSGRRVGVYGWAVSVNIPGTYDHDGRLSAQVGVWGRAGFQGDANQSPATARIDRAVGVKGEIVHASPLATINNGVCGEFTCIDEGGITENNVAVYAEVSGGTETNYAFFGEAGEIYNKDRVYFGDGSVTAQQSSCAITARGGEPNALEFGNGDAGGYGSNIGSSAPSGSPFVAFCAEADASGNTFTTRGKAGSVIYGDLAGAVVFSRLTNASAAGQTPTDDVIWRPDGSFYFYQRPRFAAAAPASASATGEQWALAVDADYIYVCVATDTWKRVAIATW